MDVDVLARAAELSARREPYALATVVWRRAPSSGHVGSKAIIRADGTIDGWLGGRLRPAHASGARRSPPSATACPGCCSWASPTIWSVSPTEGMVKVPMACESEGALEIYLDPMLPGPQLVVIGRSPAVFTLTRLAAELDWSVTVIDQDGRPDDHPRPRAGAHRARPVGPRHRARLGRRRGHPGHLRRPGPRGGPGHRGRLRGPGGGREAGVGHPRPAAGPGRGRRSARPGAGPGRSRPGPDRQRRHRGGRPGRARGPPGPGGARSRRRSPSTSARPSTRCAG